MDKFKSKSELIIDWLMKLEGISYRELEVEYGIPIGSISKWVKGTRPIGEKYIDLLFVRSQTFVVELSGIVGSNGSIGIEGKTGIIESVGFGGRVDVTIDATRPVTFTGFGVSKFNEMLAEFEGLTSGLVGVGDIVGEVKKKLLDFRGRADGCGLLNFRQRDSLMGRVDNIMRGNWSPWKVYKKAV